MNFCFIFKCRSERQQQLIFSSREQNPTSPDIGVSLSKSNTNAENLENHPYKSSKIEIKEVDIRSLEHNLGLQQQIWEYPIEQQDEAYIQVGPYECKLSKYPKSRPQKVA